MSKKILKFESNWCAPCKALDKTLSSPEFNNVEIIHYDIEDENNLELVSKFKIKSLPTLVYIENDVEIDRTIGNVSKEIIINKIN